MAPLPDRVLVVDDEEEVCRLLQLFLSTAGIDVETCESGTEALARLAHGGVALVISDVHMPEMDGLTLCRRIERDYPDVDVLFHTAFIEDLATAGISAARIIPKPADKSTIVGVVRRLLSEKKLNLRLDHVEERVSEVHDTVKVIGAQVAEMTLAVSSIQRNINGRLDNIEATATEAMHEARTAATDAAKTAVQALDAANKHASAAETTAIEALNLAKSIPGSMVAAKVWPEIFRPFRHKAVALVMGGAGLLIVVLGKTLWSLGSAKLTAIDAVPKIEQDINTIRVGQQAIGENMRALMHSLRRASPEPALAWPSARPSPPAPRRVP